MSCEQITDLGRSLRRCSLTRVYYLTWNNFQTAFVDPEFSVRLPYHKTRALFLFLLNSVFLLGQMN